MTSRSSVRGVPIVIVLLPLSALVGCAAATGQSPAASDAVVRESVCAAAVADSVRSAELEFAQSHEGLHRLARDLQERDERAAAGRLLEAKQSVEADLAELPPDGALFRDLAELADATITALSIIDPDTPRCDERTDP